MDNLHYKFKASCNDDNIYNYFKFIKRVYAFKFWDRGQNLISGILCHDIDIDININNIIEYEIISQVCYNDWIDIFIKCEKKGFKNMRVYESFAPIEMYNSEKLYLFYKGEKEEEEEGEEGESEKEAWEDEDYNQEEEENNNLNR